MIRAWHKLMDSNAAQMANQLPGEFLISVLLGYAEPEPQIRNAEVVAPTCSSPHLAKRRLRSKIFRLPLPLAGCHVTVRNPLFPSIQDQERPAARSNTKIQ
jgi:hypothetical protein